MRNTKGIPGTTRALGTSSGLARVLAATAVCGAAVVGAAPAATAGEDPGGVSSCPKGSLATSAIGSYVGVAVPVGAEGPSGAGSAAEAVGNSGTTSEVPMFGELVGRACYQRNGGTATMRPPGPAERERAPDGVYGLAGYWSSEPPQGSPKWQGETTCA